MKVISDNSIKRWLKRISEQSIVYSHWNANLDVVNSLDSLFYIIKHRAKPMAYSVLDDDDKVILSVIVEKINNGCIKLLGDSEKFDFIDFFYVDNYSYEQYQAAIRCYFSFLKNGGATSINWSFLSKDSISYQIIKDCKATIYNEKSYDYVNIEFGDEVESYFNSLSKHTRQNIRTARNRLYREQHSVEFMCSCIPDSNITKKDINECLACYADRQIDKYNKKKIHKYTYMYTNFLSKLMKQNIGFIAILKIDGEVAAFMHGFEIESRCKVEIPRLAINDKFAFYSPGMLLVVDTIEALRKYTEARNLDLCRGTEDYKVKLNGSIYDTVSFTLDLAKEEI